MTKGVLSVDNLEVSYGHISALRGISFDLPDGSTLAVLGANGAGKSTLARAISGLIPSSSGNIVLAGTDVTNWSATKIRRYGLTHIPEGRGIFPTLTVAENLRMSVRTLRGRGEQETAINAAFELFPILFERQAQRAGTLSGGEQQMLSLARGLIVSPTVLVADELGLGLAPLMVDLLYEHIEATRQSGVTIVLIEQFVHRALSVADYVLVLRQGRSEWYGPALAIEADEIVHTYMGRD